MNIPHNNNDYRTMFNNVIGPILQFVGLHLNKDGILQSNYKNDGPTLNGKHLYVPEDGKDAYRSKDSVLLAIFNPFKIKDHTLILIDFVSKVLSDRVRDEDDVDEFTADGRLIDIVYLVTRKPNNNDKVPAQFSGSIFEIWCRDHNDILAKYIDYDNNDIKSLLILLFQLVSKYSLFIEPNFDTDRIFRYVQRVEVKKDIQIEEEKITSCINNKNVDLSSSIDMADIYISGNRGNVGDLSDIKSDVIDSNYSATYIYSSLLDEVDFS